MFLTSKLRPTDLGHTRCVYAVKRILEELDTEYLDLLLIHGPTVPPVLGMAPGPEAQVVIHTFLHFIQMFVNISSSLDFCTDLMCSSISERAKK